MATKNYMINDKWLDLDKQNIVELQSVDGELDSLKVNGSEVVTPSGKITITENGTDIDVAQYALADVNVEGGGGSSDFSTAILTVTGDVSNNSIPALLVDPEYGVEGAYGSTNGLSSPFTVILYKGKAYADLPQGTTTGGIVWDDDVEMYVITGDGTLTIS